MIAKKLLPSLIIAGTTLMALPACKHKPANTDTQMTADTSAVSAAPAPTVTTSPDDALTTAVKDAVKDFPTVTATVNDGVITATGELEKSKIIVLKQALDALHPKKVDLSGIKAK
ncbi:hypothetical protein A9P82_04100 [Arachidicoccus ginsenosidimutans]|uniref:hypothetical protein n=1 Tax=Arachidicoccus sp. BS20 TaxID=1850526 RepID=UPI0007F16444|nr:hypothetical protein [Arachidicoccus sp. BS20]ANI88549.1 hypothetical protein A9P82_04100 [Arachidicoccus sp. BS20]